MGSLVVVAEQSISGSPLEVFDLFGTGEGAGWLFDAGCDLVAVGSVVTLQLPTGPGDRNETVQVLGRVTGLVPGQRITVSHDQPWRGRLRVLFNEASRINEASRSSTRVTVMAEVDERGLEWLARRRGWPVPEPNTDGAHQIGLLTSKSGAGAIFAVACDNLAVMAVDEINADGGLNGRPMRLLVGDDATDAVTGASEARRLVNAGCRVVFASVTSATFSAVERAVGIAGVPLVHTVLNEGGGGPGHVFRLGERPADQLKAAAARLMHDCGARCWFLVGNDYSWSHGAHGAARRVLPRAKGVIVGECYVPLGTTDYTSIIEQIARSGADLVLSTLVGADEVAFERQSLAMGLRSRCRTLSLVLDESTRERIGDRAADGLWAAFGYFQQLPNQDNKAFLGRYHEAFGRWAPPVSTMSESVYEAVLLYAAAARRSRDGDTRQVVAELHRQQAAVPRGIVAMDGPHVYRQALYVAEACPGGFRLLDSTA